MEILGKGKGKAMSQETMISVIVCSKAPVRAEGIGRHYQRLLGPQRH